MSELARNEFGHDWTPCEVKDLFNANGTRFERFNCVFCDVSVHPYACYGNDFVRAPRFDIAEVEHVEPCPYASGAIHSTGERKRSQLTLEGVEIYLPERFVAIRKPTAGLPINPAPTMAASFDEIKKRLSHLGKTNVVTATYTTSLLENLMAARKVAVRDLYRLADTRRIENTQKSAFVYDNLKNCPLHLYNQKTNYRDAFRTTKIPPSSSRIVYSGRGLAQETAEGFSVTSLDCPIDRFSDVLADIQPKAVIFVNIDINRPLNLMQQRTANKLLTAVRMKATVEWAAYGLFRKSDSSIDFLLDVQDPCHFCIF